jgi:hypothetical protein
MRQAEIKIVAQYERAIVNYSFARSIPELEKYERQARRLKRKLCSLGIYKQGNNWVKNEV